MLPHELEPLGELVSNLRWSWHQKTQDVFAAVDPELWEQVGRDPVRLLGEVPSDRLAKLAKDEVFLARVREAHDDLRRYLTDDRWYQEHDGDSPKAVAYFSPEFGITHVLPQYSGGLGILAGDHLKAASDLGVPVIGVGLLYQRGYFRQALDSATGAQTELYPYNEPSQLPIAPVRTADGERLRLRFQLPGRDIWVRAWEARVGRVRLR